MLVFTASVATEVEAQMSSVSSGQTININAHSICRNVTNSGGPTPMIPWNSATEWNYFVSYKPSHISLGACRTVEGPYFMTWNPYYRWSAYGPGDEIVWNSSVVKYMGTPASSRTEYTASDGWTYYRDYYVNGAGYPTNYAIRRER